jgi:glycosyltransferase involved in cell wall biosynthesis
LISEYYPPFAPGGAERSIQLLAQELNVQPAVERVVVMTPNYGAAASEAEGDVIIERFAFPFKLHKRRIHPYSLLANPAFYLYSAWQIKRLVRKHKLDVLHVQNKQSVVGTVWAARGSGVPVVVTVRDVMILCRFGMCLNNYNKQPHGCDPPTYGKCLRDYLALYMPKLDPLRRIQFWVMALFQKLDTQLKVSMMRRADAAVTISDKLGEILRSRGVNPPRMVTIYNPIPEIMPESQLQVGRRKEAHDFYEIFFAGRLSWGKGAQLLIEAMPAVCAALAPQPVHLTIAGDGPLHKMLASRVTALGVAEAVKFVGSVAQTEMQGYYANADVVVVPSVVQEGFGRVALEALVAGTPVVASTHGGLPEIVEDGFTGFVVDPEPQPLAEAIVKVLRDAPAFRRRVAESLPKMRVKFGSDVSERHVALYASLLKPALKTEEPVDGLG